MPNTKDWKRKIQHFIYSKKIATKMSVLMITIITLVFLCTVAIFQTYNKRILYENTQEAAITNLTSVNTLVENIIENINTYSYICLSDSDLQQGLVKEKVEITDFRNIEQIEDSLIELISKIDLIESVYIFDTENFLCYSDKSGNNPLRHSNIQDYSWYRDVGQDGQYHVIYRCDDFFRNPDKIPGISFARAIRSLDSMQTIGYMMIHISQEMVEKLLLNLDDNESQMKFYIFSDKDHVLLNTLDSSMQKEAERLGIQLVKEGRDSATEQIGNVRCQISVYQTETLTYMGVTPFDDLHQQEKGTVLLTMILLAVQAAIIIIAALFVSHWYTRPIEKLMESMEEVKNGHFKQIEIKTKHREVQNLIDVYHEMVGEIQNLLEKTKQVEMQKRKAELEVLSTQMNPHFLYNTFDSIKSLFLLKRYEDAYHMMCELAQFYKISLSKGDEYITIEKEVQMVANYIEIQKMRYGEDLQVDYDVDPEVGGYKILKLVLQPLVENAITHGIHGFVEEGRIAVRIKEEKGYLSLVVEDNGIGMTENTLNNVLNGKNTGAGKSFGLMGTIRRLVYCYGGDMVYKITSRINRGTKIQIYIPMKDLCNSSDRPAHLLH